RSGSCPDRRPLPVHEAGPRFRVRHALLHSVVYVPSIMAVGIGCQSSMCDNFRQKNDVQVVYMTNIAAVRHYGFLLLPEFSMLSFASTIEPLRMANRLAQQTLFSWDLYGLDDAPVRASNGLTMMPTRRCDDT